jgi:FkbM family methyltransferase
MKIFFFAQHLSTGGMPQYLVWSIENLIKEGTPSKNIFVIEYTDITGGKFVVQKTRIQNLITQNLITLLGNGREKATQFQDLIAKEKPDIIHMQEFPEIAGLPADICKIIYSETRKHKVIETSHDSSFNPAKKMYLPDGFSFINSYHATLYSSYNIPSKIIEYTIPEQVRPDRTVALTKLRLNPEVKHVLNIGLFTPRKNQAELIYIAKLLQEYPIQFHFVGNTADNFKSYWEPILNKTSKNCTIWGERNDPESFYSAADIFYFSSKPVGEDKESNPLVIKESISWKLPMLLYNHDTYNKIYNNTEGLTFLKDDILDNCKLLLEKLGFDDFSKIKPLDQVDVSLTFNAQENRINMTYHDLISQTLDIVIRDADTNLPIYNTELTFAHNSNYWINPCQAIKFIDVQHFNGFTVELYKNDTRILSKELWLRKNPPFTKTKFNVYPLDALYYNFIEFYEFKLYDDMIKPGDIILDIGASSGTFTNYALDQGAAHSYAVEPFPRSVKNLRQTFSDDPRVTIIDKAISDVSGKKNFYMFNKNSTMGSLYQQEDKFKFEEEVDAITFQELFDTYKVGKIDLLKMDTEGSEYAIFDTIQSLDIPKLIIEFHYNKGEVNKLLEKLKTLNYEYDIHENSSYRPGSESLYFGNITAFKYGKGKPVQKLVASPPPEPIVIKSEPQPFIKQSGPQLTICQIQPGSISIPPKNWGAVENIIWGYKKCFEEKGHIVDILYPLDIHKSYNIVHAHIANQAILLKQRNIPYFFSMQDHHVVTYGKDSPLYQQQIEAIKGSLCTFLGAEFLFEFFQEVKDKLRYLQHSTDTSYFLPSNSTAPNSILCVGNTLYDMPDGSLQDRKGFELSIQAANQLGIPITIAGPTKSNEDFAKGMKAKGYKFMNILDATQDELLYLYQSHAIFAFPSFLEGGHPPVAVIEALACGLPVVATYLGKDVIANETLVKERTVENVKKAILNSMYNYNKLSQRSRELAVTKYDWHVVADKLENYYKEFI